MSESRLTAGWGFAWNARKAHYFVEGEIISLCRRLMFAGIRYDESHDSKNNCAECKRKRAKLMENAS